MFRSGRICIPGVSLFLCDFNTEFIMQYIQEFILKRIIPGMFF